MITQATTMGLVLQKIAKRNKPNPHFTIQEKVLIRFKALEANRRIDKKLGREI